ncbi:MAG: hypothetical protein MJ252_00185 [archaeon]|nr:hypothetical protein [archaeon]
MSENRYRKESKSKNQNVKADAKLFLTVNKEKRVELKSKDKIDVLSELVDNISKRSLGSSTNSNFKKSIDDLNLQFYLETEKYLSNTQMDKKCQDSLFIILFREITLCIDEIERLNLELKNNNNFITNDSSKSDEGINKILSRTSNLQQKQKELDTKEQLISTLKNSNAQLENKLMILIENENKLKAENEQLMKENEALKLKLKNFLVSNSNNLPLKKSLNNISNNNTITNCTSNQNSSSLLNSNKPFSHLTNLAYSTIEKNKSLNKDKKTSEFTYAELNNSVNISTNFSKGKRKGEFEIPQKNKAEYGYNISSNKDKFINSSGNFSQYLKKSNPNFKDNSENINQRIKGKNNKKIEFLETNYYGKENQNNYEMERNMNNLLNFGESATFGQSVYKESQHLNTEVFVSDLEDDCYGGINLNINNYRKEYGSRSSTNKLTQKNKSRLLISKESKGIIHRKTNSSSSTGAKNKIRGYLANLYITSKLYTPNPNINKKRQGNNMFQSDLLKLKIDNMK